MNVIISTSLEGHMVTASKKIEQKFYNLENIWQCSELFPYQKNVITDLLNNLPEDIQNIIDLGCGDGYITNMLPQCYDVVATDWSLAAIKSVQKNKFIGSIDHLAIADNTFDLVMANDVIEHIPDDSYAFVLSEIERISKKYILLTVPFEENLENYKTNCLHCGEEYHVNLHKRSYYLDNIYALFSNEKWKIIKIIFSGEEVDSTSQFNEIFRYDLALKRHWNKAMCPACGSQESVDFGSQCFSYTDEIDPFITQMTAHHAKRNECIVLFEKKESKPQLVRSNKFALIDSMNGHVQESKINIDQGQPYLRCQDNATNTNLTISYRYKNIEYLLPRAQEIYEKGYIIPEWFYKIIRNSFKNKEGKDLLLANRINSLKDTYLIHKKIALIERRLEKIISIALKFKNIIKKISKIIIFIFLFCIFGTILYMVFK